MEDKFKPTLDPLETAILYLLNVQHDGSHAPNIIKSALDGALYQYTTSEDYFKDIIKHQKPKNMLLINDLSNDERLFTLEPGLLLRPVHEIIGASTEIAFCGSDYENIKWFKYKRLNGRPKGFVPAVFGELIYYESHYRLIDVTTKKDEYITHVHAWSPKNNRFFPVAKERADLSHFFKSAAESTDTFILCASAIEDSQCKYFFMVSLTVDVTINFYVDCDAVKSLFKLRDNPLTANDRRRPIIHWVCEHLRKKPVNPGYAEIPEHLRGVNEFDFEGFQIKITSPKATNDKFKDAQQEG